MFPGSLAGDARSVATSMAGVVVRVECCDGHQN